MKNISMMILATLTLLTFSFQNVRSTDASIGTPSGQQVWQMNQDEQMKSEEIVLDGIYLKAFASALEDFEKG